MHNVLKISKKKYSSTGEQEPKSGLSYVIQLGIKIGDSDIWILMYADDILLIMRRAYRRCLILSIHDAKSGEC